MPVSLNSKSWTKLMKNPVRKHMEKFHRAKQHVNKKKRIKKFKYEKGED